MSMPEITGSGKGGSRRDPIDHPNTLQARSTARLIDLISEGPIYGLVEQTDRLRSIFMDDTPCKNTDGSVNYAGVGVHERYGYSDQDVMPGFAQVESDISAGHTLTTVSPFLFTVSDSTVKQVRLRVRLGGLYKQNISNGDVEPTSVDLKIEVGSSGSSGASAVDDLPLTTGVASITVVDKGSGYDPASPPTVTISGNDGTGATATATVNSKGEVTSITVTNSGSGYTAPPTVVISGTGTGAYAESALQTAGGSGYTSAPTVTFTGGNPDVAATAIAEISGGRVTGLFLTTGVASAAITSGGSGYTSAPTVAFTGGGGTGAAGTATVSNGVVTSITVTNSGSGYTTAPTITLTGGGGTGATAIAVGQLAGGSGYDSAPTVTLSGGGGTGAVAIAKVSPYHIYGGLITISGKTVGAYEEAYLIDLEEFSERLQAAGLSAAAYPLTIRVSRVTADSQQATVSDTVQISGYTEIQPYNLTYADSAVIGLVVDAQKFGGNIPRRSYDVKGRIVRVPTGYAADSESPTVRTYPAFWDGTFETKWTNNPAWIMFDILTNERYGLGLSDSDVDVYTLYQISKYCDELVPIQLYDENGNLQETYEYRYTCNTTIASQREAYQVLQSIASNFRGMVYASTAGVSFSQDRPKDAVRLVAPADVINGTFTYSSTSRKARHSVALITWNDPADNYKQAIEVVEDLDLIDRYQYNPIEAVAYGCTSQSQARRMGRWILDSERYETDTVTFQGGLDFIDLMPGDIINVADPMKQSARLGGRIMGYDFPSLTPSGAATSTTTSGSSISSLSLVDDAVFECVVKLSANVKPEGCIWEVGDSTSGAYLGFNADGDLVLRAGYGGSDFASFPEQIARLVVDNEDIPTGREAKILCHVDTLGRVRMWINNQFVGEASTSDASPLSPWANSTNSEYGGSSGDIVAGESGNYSSDTNVELVTNLSYWSSGVVRTITSGFTLDDEPQVPGSVLTSVTTYTGATGSIHSDAKASFECSVQMPSSGIPTGLIFELGSGSTSATEGTYVGFNSSGDLVFHAGQGGSPADTAQSATIIVPSTQFTAGKRYHLMWAIDPDQGRIGLWVNWQFFSIAQTTDSTSFSNTQFANSENGGYGILSSTTVAGQVTSVFNGNFLTPLRYYEGESVMDESSSENYGSILLDQEYTTEVGDQIMFMNREMNIDLVPVKSGTSGRLLTLLSYATNTPIDNGMFNLQTTSAEPKKYRVLSIREIQPNRYEVIGLEYDPTKFDRIEQGLLIDRPSTSLFPTGSVRPPSDLAYRESLYRTSGDVLTKIDLSCVPSTDPRVNLYQFDIRRPGSADTPDSWQELVTHSSPTAVIANAEPGSWSFRVTAIAGGTKSTTSSRVVLENVQIYGKSLPPADVTNLTASRQFTKVRLKWDGVPDLDLRDYAIVQGTTWDSAAAFYSNSTDITVTVNTTNDVTFLVRARDTSGNISENSASVVAVMRTLTGVSDLQAHQRFDAAAIYSAKVALSWRPIEVRDEVISYEVRATDELDDAQPGGVWSDLETLRETNSSRCDVFVPLISGSATTVEMKLRPYIQLEQGSRVYGTESSVQILLYPGNGTSIKTQNEHTTWSALSSSEATAFIENGRAPDLEFPKNTVVTTASGGGWILDPNNPAIDRSSSAVFALRMKVFKGLYPPTGCVFEVGNSTKGCYLGFNAAHDLVFRAGYGGSDFNANSTEIARIVIPYADIPTNTEFQLLCEVRNDGVASGRVRLWIDGTLMDSDETTDFSAFNDQLFAADADGLFSGYLSGYSDGIVTGESAGYDGVLDADPNSSSKEVEYVTDLQYWRATTVKSPLDVVSGKLQLADGLTYAKYQYDFDLSQTFTGELNYDVKAQNIAAGELTIFEAQSLSVYDAADVPIVPTTENSPDRPSLSFSFDAGRTGTYLPLVSGSMKSFQTSSVRVELTREENSAYRPSISSLTTVMGKET